MDIWFICCALANGDVSLRSDGAEARWLRVERQPDLLTSLRGAPLIAAVRLGMPLELIKGAFGEPSFVHRRWFSYEWWDYRDRNVQIYIPGKPYRGPIQIHGGLDP
jgi:hypothetical protein